MVADPYATARWAATYAQCSRRRVGAVLVFGGEVVGWGANKSREPALSCLNGDCPRGRLSYAEQPAYAPYGDCIAKHAEVAAIEMAGALAKGAVLYVTAEPCDDCREALGKAGCHTTVLVYPDAVLQATLPASVARSCRESGQPYPPRRYVR